MPSMPRSHRFADLRGSSAWQLETLGAANVFDLFLAVLTLVFGKFSVVEMQESLRKVQPFAFCIYGTSG